MRGEPCPLEPFFDQFSDKQEEMRTRGPGGDVAEPLSPDSDNTGYCRGCAAPRPPGLLEAFLFLGVRGARLPRRDKMTFGRLGQPVQAALDEPAPAADGWTYVTHGPHTLYTYQVTNVIP